MYIGFDACIGNSIINEYMYTYYKDEQTLNKFKWMVKTVQVQAEQTL